MAVAVAIATPIESLINAAERVRIEIMLECIQNIATSASVPIARYYQQYNSDKEENNCGQHCDYDANETCFRLLMVNGLWRDNCEIDKRAKETMCYETTGRQLNSS